jgi:hypothetical protein
MACADESGASPWRGVLTLGPVLLHTDRLIPQWSIPGHGDGPAHQDEAQVALDTARSFVTYPLGERAARGNADVGIRPEHKLAMQADLHELIVGVLRRYPGLSYFQVGACKVKLMKGVS